MKKVIYILIYPIRAYIAFRVMLSLVPTWDDKTNPYFSYVTNKAWGIANKFFISLNPDF